MENKSIVKEKSYNFALRIIKLYQYLNSEKKEFVIAKQLLRSGTSIGANIEEALSGQSKKDFIAKLSISLKEAKESNYWLRLLHDSGYIDTKSYSSIIIDSEEIIKIITAILKTSRKNLEKTNSKLSTINSQLSSINSLSSTNNSKFSTINSKL